MLRADDNRSLGDGGHGAGGALEHVDGNNGTACVRVCVLSSGSVSASSLNGGVARTAAEREPLDNTRACCRCGCFVHRPGQPPGNSTSHSAAGAPRWCRHCVCGWDEPLVVDAAGTVGATTSARAGTSPEGGAHRRAKGGPRKSSVSTRLRAMIQRSRTHICDMGSGLRWPGEENRMCALLI